MKSLLIAAVAVVGLCATAQAHEANEIYASGPASLVPAETGLNTLIWVGGDVAQLLFESMTQAPSQVDPVSKIEGRLGKNVRCLHNASSVDMTYSCAVEVELSTGTAVAH